MEAVSRIKSVLGLWKRAAMDWNGDNAMALGAAMAYYALFSIAPLLIISIAVAGLAFGPEASRGEIFRALEGLIGTQGAQGVQAMVEGAAKRPGTGILASVAGVATLLVGASGVFSQLQQALNSIWRVQPSPHASWWGWLRRRVLSFSMILVIAFLLLVSLVATAALSALASFMSQALPGGELVWQAFNFVLSFGLVTLLFAAIYKILPDVRLEWADVWIGGAVTAALFSLGKFAIGAYLGHSGVASTYGAAGSVVVLLLWVFYSSCILLLGAEFTRAFATRGGRTVKAKPGAVRVSGPQVLGGEGTQHGGAGTTRAA